MELPARNFSVILLTAARGGGFVAMRGETVDGPHGAAHPSGSHAIWTNGIGVDVKSLDTVSAAPSTVAGSTSDLPSFFDPSCSVERGMRRSPGDLYTVYSWLRGRRTPLERRAVLPRRYWGRRPLPVSRATQRHTKLALRVKSVQRAGTSVSPAGHCAQSHQRPTRLPSHEPCRSTQDRLSVEECGVDPSVATETEYHSTGDNFERFRPFLELIRRFDFDFCRCGNYNF